jgi:hypothetical protein
VLRMCAMASTACSRLWSGFSMMRQIAMVLLLAVRCPPLARGRGG